METSEKNLEEQIANLPIALHPAPFTTDELALIIGTYVPDPVFVIESQSGLLVAVNSRFLQMLGIEAEEALDGDLMFDRLVIPADRPLFSTWRGADHATGSSFELRLSYKNREEVAVEITLSHLRWVRQDYLLGFARPTSNFKKLEQQYKQNVAEQKRRTMEAIKSSMRIYQITEKIEKTLALTKTLLNTENETQLFEITGRILTSEGLNYRDVTILMENDGHLEIQHSTRSFVLGRRFSLSDDNEYSQFVRRNFEDTGLRRDRILVPLLSREKFLGLLEVTLREKERIFFEDMRIVSEWQKNVLFTVADVIALHLDNMRLYGQLKRQSIIDPLTGVYNRHYFVNHLSAEMHRSVRTGRSLSMIFIDIDNFKAVNDVYGHLQGDLVLRELGGLFVENLREEDCICRYGGDEFVIILPEVDLEGGQKIAQKLLEAVKAKKFDCVYSEESRVPITISLGVSVLEADQDEDLFMQSADGALYKAKKLGRNRFELG